jgi:lipoprotein-releasing system ATP-binding protein
MTTPPGGLSGHVIVADGVEFRYRGDVAVLRNFSHVFHPGSLTVVAGPSGCGKSTLLYLLGLMLTPTGGRILWDDVDASGRSDAERSFLRGRSVGFIFQDAVLDPSRTILANVAEGGLYAGMKTGAAREAALELLDVFGVGRRAQHRPGEISGGQAQRVALCRALVKQPRLILADEPTGNLDDANADAVWHTLAQAARRGVPVVVATHDQRRAASADALVEL